MVEPRRSAPTVKFVDDYCQLYQNLFPEVRSFEAFKYLHVGMVSEIKRKTLPAMPRASRKTNFGRLKIWAGVSALRGEAAQQEE